MHLVLGLTVERCGGNPVFDRCSGVDIFSSRGMVASCSWSGCGRGHRMEEFSYSFSHHGDCAHVHRTGGSAGTACYFLLPERVYAHPKEAGASKARARDARPALIPNRLLAGVFSIGSIETSATDPHVIRSCGRKIGSERLIGILTITWGCGKGFQVCLLGGQAGSEAQRQ